MIEQLEAVLRTLDSIEIHGKMNLDRMLACIMQLEKILQTVKEEKPDGNN